MELLDLTDHASDEAVEQPAGFALRLISLARPNAGKIALMALSGLATIAPAPFSPKYLFQRAFFTPHFRCKDSVFSFADSSRGACSSHGGIKEKINENEN